MDLGYIMAKASMPAVAVFEAVDVSYAATVC